MTRTQLLWLFIWIFIFFLVICLWNKLKDFTPTHTTATAQSLHINDTPNANNTKKDMYFKALKVGKTVTLAGIVATEDDKEQMVDAYGKVFDEVKYDDLQINTQVQEKTPLNFFINFADTFSKFESGYLAYDNGLLEIDGMAEHTIVKQTLQEQLSELKDIKIENKLHIGYNLNEDKNTTAPTIPSPDTNLTKEKETVTSLSIEEMQTLLDKVLQKKRVQFLYARNILTSASKSLIDEIITLLEENKEMKLKINGHTDSDGTKKRNLILSQKRAESVMGYMIQEGIAKNRLRAYGYGESEPLVKNDTLKNKRTNRRVEFKVIGE